MWRKSCDRNAKGVCLERVGLDMPEGKGHNTKPGWMDFPLQLRDVAGFGGTTSFSAWKHERWRPRMLELDCTSFSTLLGTSRYSQPSMLRRLPAGWTSALSGNSRANIASPCASSSSIEPTITPRSVSQCAVVGADTFPWIQLGSMATILSPDMKIVERPLALGALRA